MSNKTKHVLAENEVFSFINITLIMNSNPNLLMADVFDWFSNGSKNWNLHIQLSKGVTTDALKYAIECV